MDTGQTDGVRYFPLDVTRLVKGQVLTVAELEPIVGLKFPNPEWSLRVLQLRGRIERLRSRLGLPVVTMRYEKGSLVICDDADAAQHNRNMGKRGLRRFARASVRNMAVDMTKLGEEEQRAHSRTLARQAMLLGAIQHAQHRHLPKLSAPPERNTPKMLSTESPTPVNPNLRKFLETLGLRAEANDAEATAFYDKLAPAERARADAAAVPQPPNQ